MRRIICLIGLVLCVCLSSCQVKSIHQGEPIKDADDTWKPYVHYFSSHPSRLLFKASLDLAGEHFSGLLVVKQMAEGEFRTVFTTETGFKIFDISIKNEGYALNYGIGPIGKKIVADRLAYTIQASLLHGFASAGYASDLNGNHYNSYRYGKYVYELKRAGDDARVESQTVYLNGRKKATARFFGNQGNTEPDSSKVTHTGFPLRASFKLLKP